MMLVVTYWLKGRAGLFADYIRSSQLKRDAISVSLSIGLPLPLRSLVFKSISCRIGYFSCVFRNDFKQPLRLFLNPKLFGKNESDFNFFEQYLLV